MDPEKQKRQFQLLLPSIICLALMGMLKAFDSHIPSWLAITLYLTLTIVCIVNAFRVLRASRQDRNQG